VAVGYSTFGTVLRGGVVVVERKSGVVRWRYPFPPPAGDAPTGFGGGPVVTRDLVIAASGDGRIHALDLRTGAARWTLPPVTRADGRVQDRDWRALALSGPLLIAGSVSGVVTAVDVRDRRERWRYAHPRGGSVGLRITADRQSVYVPHLAGLLVALRLRDGQPRWEVGGFDAGFSWAPVLSGGLAYVSSSRTGFFAFPK
jgi:outer membrane protein assembly factor BamB